MIVILHYEYMKSPLKIGAPDCGQKTAPRELSPVSKQRKRKNIGSCQEKSDRKIRAIKHFELQIVWDLTNRVLNECA